MSIGLPIMQLGKRECVQLLGTRGTEPAGVPASREASTEERPKATKVWAERTLNDSPWAARVFFS